jgi:FMN-dependent NADH-azoreductase
MSNLLHIDTSPRKEQSFSRTLARKFLETWKNYHPDADITYRDLGLNPLPYIDETWVTAKFTLPDQYTPELADAIRLSDELIDEFLAADRYVISSPMYNLSIPAVFKSYIDYIVRPRRTFTVDEGSFKGLVTGKKILIATARGSDFRPESALAAIDFQEPYLRTIFNFIGITDIQFIHANGLRTERREQALTESNEAIQAIAASW